MSKPWFYKINFLAIIIFSVTACVSPPVEKIPITTVQTTEIAGTLIKTAEVEADLQTPPTSTLSAAGSTAAVPGPTTSPTEFHLLTTDEARETLLTWLTTNRDCELPCVLGITPGETTAIEAQGPLQSISSMSDFFGFTPELVDISYLLPQENITATIRVNYLIAEDTVNQVIFSGRAYMDNGDPDVRGIIEVFDSPFLGNILGKYMIPALLNDLGRPDAVQIQTLSRHWSEGFVPPQPPVKFNIMLIYPQQRVFALYSTEMKVDGDRVTGCFANAHVSLKMHPLDVPIDFFWESVEMNVDYKDGLPLEQATSMTIENFYAVFSQEETDCIDSPAEIWPEPEF